MSKTAKWLIGIFAFLAVFFLFVVFSFMTLLGEDETEDVSGGTAGTVALVELNEPIMSSERIVQQLKRFRENPSVRAIVLRIESPGGGVAASQEIYEEVKKTRAYGKPIVVSMGSVAASGGYYAAIGASRIVANPGSVVGSIGVISQFMHVNDLLAKIGVSSTTIKSGSLKDAGSPYRQPTAEDKRYFQEMVDDIYDQFVTAVAEERKLDKSLVRKYADGRVFTGRKAYDLGLIDTLGTYQDAITIAAEMAQVYGTPRVIKERKRETLSERLFGVMKDEVRGLKNELLQQPVVEYRYQQPQ
ncbi:MAG: signal peptide peptidase SppA [Bacteroidetes bacterium]|nr:signal peptide peptidase SppA [Bacteroidota bacterium]